MITPSQRVLSQLEENCIRILTLSSLYIMFSLGTKLNFSGYVPIDFLRSFVGTLFAYMVIYSVMEWIQKRKWWFNFYVTGAAISFALWMYVQFIRH